MFVESVDEAPMTGSPPPKPDSPVEPTPSVTDVSGGVNLEAQHDANIGDDVVGRDKTTTNIDTKGGAHVAGDVNATEFVGRDNIESAGGHIIHAGQGATVNVITGTPPTRRRALYVSLSAIGLVIIAAIIAAFFDPQIIDGIASLFKPKCPYQDVSDSITLVNLINAEAEAVNRKDMTTLEKIFAPNARIRNRVSDKNASEKKLEWTSPQAYYRDFLFVTTTVTSALHSNIEEAGQGIGSAEAWMTSASSGYANGSPYDNPPGSDHWRLNKNQNGCWVIAEFDFNASHIPFP